jgi:hypothetical protein
LTLGPQGPSTNGSADFAAAAAAALEVVAPDAASAGVTPKLINESVMPTMSVPSLIRDAFAR